MAADPAALQLWLRQRQTVVEVAAEKNSTLVMPVRVELLRFIDRPSRAPGTAHLPGDGPAGAGRRSSPDPRRFQAGAGRPAGRG
jgi:hypothetical protein